MISAGKCDGRASLLSSSPTTHLLSSVRATSRKLQYLEGDRMSVWRHLRAILILPFMVTVTVPVGLVWLCGSDTFGVWSWHPVLRPLLTALGTGFCAVGLYLMARTISHFAKIGRGTLAPWDPTQQLVVRGVYRHVRNPMITGVFAILLGECLLVTSVPLAVWFGFFALMCGIVIPLWEEPDLVKRFGQPYQEYRENVPRWIPRRTAWQSGVDE